MNIRAILVLLFALAMPVYAQAPETPKIALECGSLVGFGAIHLYLEDGQGITIKIRCGMQA